MILVKLFFMCFFTVTTICTILWLFTETEPDMIAANKNYIQEMMDRVNLLQEMNVKSQDCHTKSNLALNKQLKLLAEELVKCNKRLKKLENK